MQKILSSIKHWIIHEYFWRKILLGVLFLLAACLAVEIYSLHLKQPDVIVSDLRDLGILHATEVNVGLMLTAIGCGLIGSKARIYMDEMMVAANHTSKVPKEDKERIKALDGYNFRKHNYTFGVIAAYVSIVTLGEDLALAHQIVIGILSSMVGSKFLLDRLGLESSLNLMVLEQYVKHSVKNNDTDGTGDPNSNS